MHTSASGTQSPQGTDAFAPTTQLGSLVDAEADWDWWLYVADAATRNALTGPKARNGVWCQQADTGGVYRRVAGAWRLEFFRASGQFTRSTNQTITTTPAPISFDSAPFLLGLSWAASPNPSRITAQVDGRYILSGSWQVNSTGTATISIRLNGTTTWLYSNVTVTNTAGACPFNIVQPIDMVAGDYVEVMVSISTGSQPWISTNKVNVDLLQLR